MIKWDAELALGHEALDEQHREMARMADLVCQAHRDSDKNTLRRHVQRLIEISAAHFVFEEEIMRETNYDGSEIHSEHHGEILAMLDRFCRDLLSGHCAGQDERVMAFFQSWLESHLRNFDRDLVRHIVKVGPAEKGT